MLLTSLMRIYLTRSFKPFVFRGGVSEPLDYENLDDLGLYVHIPFCRSLCSFCPYCKVVYDQHKAADYKTALLKEIELAAQGTDAKKEVTSLYFGGGTPALMINDLKEIIDALQRHFTIRGGIGVELHPDDLSDETLRKLKHAGVTMVSLGIQSFNEDCLGKLGRRGKDFAAKVQLARDYSFDVTDVDLIFAIPGQTHEILAEDVKTAFESGATQISTYPFIDFTFADNRYKPLPQKVKKKMLKKLTAYCRSLQVDRTSVWTFAKPGTEKYSSVTRDTFLGFGVSATSLLKDRFKINTFSIESYIDRVEAGRLPTSLTLHFTLRQRAVYFLFWSAYGMKIDPRKFEKTIGVPLSQMFGVELWLFEKLGYLRKKDGLYELTEKAAEMYHIIEQVYTTAYIDKMWNISRNQPFPEQILLK